MTINFMTINELYDFMKYNYVIRAKIESLELELHPLAFAKNFEPEPEPELEPEKINEYEEFVFPSKEKLTNAGI